MTNEELNEILARAAAASPGPWVADGSAVEAFNAPIDPDIAITGSMTIHSLPAEHEANAAFIAAAREDVPNLVAEVRRLRAERGEED